MERTAANALNKAYGAFWTVGAHLVKPAVAVHWIHTMLIRPVLTYSSTVWWPSARYRAQEVTEISLSGHNRQDLDHPNSCNAGSSATAASSSCDD
jgi:hypothetical protein